MRTRGLPWAECMPQVCGPELQTPQEARTNVRRGMTTGGLVPVFPATIMDGGRQAFEPLSNFWQCFRS